MSKFNKTIEDELYFYGLIALAAIALGCLFIFLTDMYEVKLPPCIFHLMTGLYCPGCGGTRAVRALLHGDILKSLWYHPFVVYGIVIYAIFMVTHTIRKYIYHNFHAMKYRNSYLYIWIAILFLNFVIKNILLIKFGVTLD